jgi:hypothetical protein
MKAIFETGCVPASVVLSVASVKPAEVLSVMFFSGFDVHPLMNMAAPRRRIAALFQIFILIDFLPVTFFKQHSTFKIRDDKEAQLLRENLVALPLSYL